VSLHLLFRPRSLRSKFSQYGKASIFHLAAKPVLSQVEEGRGEDDYDCEYEDDFEETYVEYDESNTMNTNSNSQWSSFPLTVSKTSTSKPLDNVNRSDSLDSVDLFEKEQERRSAIYLKRRETLRRKSQSTSRAVRNQRNHIMKRRNQASSPNPDVGPETRSNSISSVNTNEEEEKKDSESYDERNEVSVSSNPQAKSRIYSKQAPISVDRTKITGFMKRSTATKAAEGKRD